MEPRDLLRPRQKENYARVDGKGLPALLRAIESYQGKNITRLAMKLLALTFVRTSELVEARWSEFDLDGARWDIPAERMKARKPHIVPLSRQAVEILRTLRAMHTGALVFPGENNPEKPMSNNTILMALKRMGYQGTMTGHGFRRGGVHPTPSKSIRPPITSNCNSRTSPVTPSAPPTITRCT